MDDIINQKEKLFFPENIGQILSDVLKEYKLEETDDEVFKKLESDQLFSGEIIMDAIRDLFFKKIQEKELSALLQQKLNISQNTAESLSDSIKTKIIPLIKKVPDEEMEEIKENMQIEKNNPLSYIKKTTAISVEENEKVLEKEGKSIIAEGFTNIEEIKKPSKKMRKSILSEENKQQSVPRPRQQRGSDSYREPVE